MEKKTPLDHQVDYKQKYKILKRKLKFLVYEQECFLEELRKAQRKLLKVTRDKNFLLDRLLQYEKVDDSSGDSDATASSDSEGEANKEGGPSKKKKSSGGSPAQVSGFLGSEAGNIFGSPGYSSLLQQGTLVFQNPVSVNVETKRKTKAKKPASKPCAPKLPDPEPERIAGQMTREELERHLESRQHSFGIEKAPAKLPMEIFSNDSSDPDSETANDMSGLAGDDEDAELVIDTQ